jgi:hypothetical protein
MADMERIFGLPGNFRPVAGVVRIVSIGRALIGTGSLADSAHGGGHIRC